MAAPESRKLFREGLRGEIAHEIQQALLGAGYDPGLPDGAFGARTARALQAFQRANSLLESGAVDAETWTKLMNCVPPDLARRALGVTAAIEGHGYSHAAGNWDGAWLTWGIVGFTLKHGSIQKIVLETERVAPERIREAFGARAGELLDMMKLDHEKKAKDRAELLQWAGSITIGHGITEPWRVGFARLGTYPEVREIQRQRAFEAYFRPGEQLAAQLGLKNELGVALCFDISVQNGGLREAAKADIEKKRNAAMSELQVREIVARAVANAARPEFAADVLSRKMAIAFGKGTVHGLKLELSAWGLEDCLPA